MHQRELHCQTPWALLAWPVHMKKHLLNVFYPLSFKQLKCVKSHSYRVQFLLTDVNGAQLRRITNTM